jgi:hypothetical protein
MVAPFPFPGQPPPGAAPPLGLLPGLGPRGLAPPPGLPPSLLGPPPAPPPGAGPLGGVVPPGMGTGPMGMMAPPPAPPVGNPMAPPFPPAGGGMPGMGGIPEPVDAGPFEDPVAIAGILAGVTDEDLPGILASLPEEAIPALIQLLGPYPQVQDRLMAALMPEEDPAPEDPWWYRDADYPKPGWGEIDGWVARAESFWQPRRVEMGVWEDIFFQRRSGLFAVDEDDAEFERFRASGIRADTRLAINHVATAQMQLDITPLAGGGREEAQRCEDTWHHWRGVQEKRYSRRSGGGLRYEEAFVAAVRGALCRRRVPVLDDPECPIADSLLDPGAVYPSWDDQGIASVAHVYQCTLNEAGATFRDKAGKVAETLRDRGPSNKWSTDAHDLVTVVEFWNRRWHAAKLRDGRVLKEPTEHGLGEPPFVFTFADTGKPTVLRRTDRQPNVTRLDGSGGSTAVSTDEEQFRDVGLPIFHDAIWHQGQLEALGSKAMQIARTADRPPVQMEQDDVAKAGNPDPEVSFEPGAITRTMKDNERLTPMQLALQAGVVQPLMGMLGSDAERLYQPKAAYGAAGGAATGNAIEGQAEAGRDKEIALVGTLERHYAECADLDFRLIQRVGHLIGKDGSRGEFRVPFARSRRREEDLPQTFVLTPRTVRKAAPQTRVRLTHVEVRNLPALANVMSMFRQNNLPIEDLIEYAGYPNGRDFMTRGVEEAVAYGPESTPLMKFMLMLEHFKGVDGRVDLPTAIWVWSAVNGGQNGPPGGGGQPGMGGGGMPPMPNSSAMNLSPQNFPQAGVGLGAGRPVSTGAGLQLGPPPGVPGGGGGLPPGF